MFKFICFGSHVWRSVCVSYSSMPLQFSSHPGNGSLCESSTRKKLSFVSFIPYFWPISNPSLKTPAQQASLLFSQCHQLFSVVHCPDNSVHSCRQGFREWCYLSCGTKDRAYIKHTYLFLLYFVTSSFRLNIQINHICLPSLYGRVGLKKAAGFGFWDFSRMVFWWVPDIPSSPQSIFIFCKFRCQRAWLKVCESIIWVSGLIVFPLAEPNMVWFLISELHLPLLALNGQDAFTSIPLYINKP